MSEEEFGTEAEPDNGSGQAEGSETLSRRERRQLQRQERRSQREIEQALEIEETEVVEEEVARGTLWVGDYRCPECDGDRIFVVLMQTRSSDEPETKICTCEGCGHKFREYQ